ncbi:MAG: hypothetical protein ACI4FX_02980 [Agathobacter sp.]
MYYLKLIGLRPDPFQTTVEEEKNFPDSEEGKKNLEEKVQEWEQKGLVCVRMTLRRPNLLG